MSNTTASSAGTRPLLGRRPPRQAIETAAKLGFDVTSHRSRIIDDETLSRGTLIFAFDLDNYNFLRASYPYWRKRFFFLGACGGEASCEIADPYGGPDHVYELCFARIKHAVEELARCVARFCGEQDHMPSDEHELKQAVPAAAARRSTQLSTRSSSA